MTYLVTCSRCNGSGKYDRGVCFRCNGAKVTKTSRKPADKYEVSAVFKDGVRRIMKAVSAKSQQEAIAKVLGAKNDWEKFFDLSTIEARSKNVITQYYEDRLNSGLAALAQ